MIGFAVRQECWRRLTDIVGEGRTCCYTEFREQIQIFAEWQPVLRAIRKSIVVVLQWARKSTVGRRMGYKGWVPLVRGGDVGSVVTLRPCALGFGATDHPPKFPTRAPLAQPTTHRTHVSGPGTTSNFTCLFLNSTAVL